MILERITRLSILAVLCSAFLSFGLKAQNCNEVLFDISPMSYCIGDPALDLNSFVNFSGGTFTGPGVAGDSFVPAIAGEGTHNLEYEYNDGTDICVFSDNIIILAPEEYAEILTDPSLHCKNGEPVLLEGTPSDASFFLNSVSPANQITYYYPEETGLDTIILIHLSNGCFSYDTLIMEVLAEEQIFSSFDLIAEQCIGSYDTIVFTGGSIHSEMEIDWNFEGAEEIENFGDSLIVIQYLTSGEYEITLELDGICVETGIVSETLTKEGIEVAITHELFPNGQAVIGLGSELIGADPADVTFQWSPEELMSCFDCASTESSSISNQTYILEVTTGLGCTASDTLNLIIENLAVAPTAFSPNLDGNNDHFSIKARNVKSMSLQIFDRWGKEWFYEEGEEPKWDGLGFGNSAPLGVYTFIAELVYIDDTKESKSGHFNLVY